MLRSRLAALGVGIGLAMPFTMVGAGTAETLDPPLGPVAGRARLTNAAGAAVGSATVHSTPHGLLLHLDLKDVAPGTHGLHIHATGVCTAPSFESSGAHLNPSGRMHGFRNPEGTHAGDLPNVFVGESKRITLDVFAPQLTAEQIFDADGSALVIHGMPDDYMTEPAGHAGDRIACGAIERNADVDVTEGEGKADLYREGRDRAANDGAASQGIPHGE